jgi:hypothetical protein
VDSLSLEITSDTLLLDSVEEKKKPRGQIREIRGRILDMQTVRREYRDSISHIHHEIDDYRDTLRNLRRHVYDATPHSLRIGWGDQMFETLIWHERGYYTTLPDSYEISYDENFRYTQHWFAEYLYSINYSYSFGIMFDYSGVLWDSVVRDGQGVEKARESNKNFHNIAIVPMVNFAYCHRNYFSLYSALGVGLNINTGSEMDYKGRYTAVAPLVNLTLLGMRVGDNIWYGAIEVGGMFSLNYGYEVYMLGSRLFTASVGVRL